MSRPSTLLPGRKVKWSELTGGHDGKIYYYREMVGYVMEHHWTTDGRCLFLIADKDGRLLTKDAAMCALHDSPLQAAIKQQIT